MARIAVIGGGFGGVYAIHELQRRLPRATITLYEPRERFVFTPLLHEVATDVLHIPSVTHAYEDIFSRQFRHVRAYVTRVDLARMRVRTDAWEQYDYVLLAHGARTRSPPRGALTMKSTEDALAIRRRVERLVLAAAKRPSPGLLHCVIVGGGPTGVELAGEIIDFYRMRAKKEHIDPSDVRVTIVGKILASANLRVKKTAERRLRRMGVTLREGRVQRVDASGAYVDGELLLSRCVIWTAGVVPNPMRGVRLVEGHVPVERTLQVRDMPRAFAIGDASLVVDAPLPDLAQVATKQGVHAARNIALLERGRTPLQFAYKHHGFLVSVGQRYATGMVLGTFIAGFPAWFIWRTVYLAKFIGVRSKARLAYEYTCRILRPRNHLGKGTND